MPHRRFRDDIGRVWDVWDVHPTDAESRDLSGGLENPVSGAARTRGWVAVEGPAERRRLAPIPLGWGEASVARLLELLAQSSLARTTPHHQPLIQESPETSARRS